MDLSKIRKGTLGAILITLLSLAPGCGKDRGTDEAGSFQAASERGPQIDAEEELPATYAEIRESILVPYCMECHKRFGTEEKFLRKVTPGSPEDSEAFQVIEDGDMPPEGPRVPKDLIVRLKKYISDLEPEVEAAE